MRRKGVSPVIATVLLIGIVVVLTLIVFLWFRGFTKEAITKFGGENVELICEDVNFRADYSSNKLAVSNIGNVPIFNVKVKITSGGSYTTKDIKEIDTSGEEWPTVGLKQGQGFEGTISGASGADELLIIPVLIGTTSSGQRKAFVCDEQYGYKLFV
jgi:flagellin-like protein